MKASQHYALQQVHKTPRTRVMALTVTVAAHLVVGLVVLVVSWPRYPDCRGPCVVSRQSKSKSANAIPPMVRGPHAARS